MRFNGQVVMITGASRGIGRGLAVAFGNQGATVAVCGRDENLLAEVVSEIETTKGTAMAFAFDVTNVRDVASAVDDIERRLGPISVCVANAGLGDNQPALEVTESTWDRMMDVNLKGVFFTVQAAAKAMLSRQYGRIVVMSSQAGLVGIRDHAVYTASKGALNSLIKVLALEWAEHNVVVNAVAPTFVYTPGTAERLDDPDYRQAVVDRIPAGQVASIGDVAGAVMYLAGAEARMVAGVVVPVDGGWTAQ